MDDETKMEVGTQLGQAARALEEQGRVLEEMAGQLDDPPEKLIEVVETMRLAMRAYDVGLANLSRTLGADVDRIQSVMPSLDKDRTIPGEACGLIISPPVEGEDTQLFTAVFPEGAGAGEVIAAVGEGMNSVPAHVLNLIAILEFINDEGAR